MSKRVTRADDPPSRTVKAHPFKTLHVFFPVISVRRPDVLPSSVRVSLNAQISYGYDTKERRHLVNLRMTTAAGESDITAEVIASGVFEYTEAGEPTRAQLVKFINEYLATAMSSRVIQLVGVLTAQMGMTPVWLPMPRGFGLTVRQLKEMEAAAITKAG
jgi:hypothetical protein